MGALLSSFILLFNACITPVAKAETLGRLFFTPAERAALDRLRANGFVELPTTNTNTNAEPKGPSEINGYVQRNDGQTAVWIDGQPHYQPQGSTKLNPSAVQTPGRITIKRSETIQAPVGK
ncbi:MAG: hypothetical protein V4568_09265 [Pseudomonadota bacterium]